MSARQLAAPVPSRALPATSSAGPTICLLLVCLMRASIPWSRNPPALRLGHCPPLGRRGTRTCIAYLLYICAHGPGPLPAGQLARCPTRLRLLRALARAPPRSLPSPCVHAAAGSEPPAACPLLPASPGAACRWRRPQAPALPFSMHVSRHRPARHWGGCPRAGPPPRSCAPPSLAPATCPNQTTIHTCRLHLLLDPAPLPLRRGLTPRLGRAACLGLTPRLGRAACLLWPARALQPSCPAARTLGDAFTIPK